MTDTTKGILKKTKDNNGLYDLIRQLSRQEEYFQMNKQVITMINGTVETVDNQNIFRIMEKFCGEEFAEYVKSQFKELDLLRLYLQEIVLNDY